MQQMLKDKDIEILKKYIINIEEIIKLNDIDELQIAIMVAIDKTLDGNNEPTIETRQLEEIYDKTLN
jgi:hypothetical protein